MKGAFSDTVRVRACATTARANHPTRLTADQPDHEIIGKN